MGSRSVGGVDVGAQHPARWAGKIGKCVRLKATSWTHLMTLCTNEDEKRMFASKKVKVQYTSGRIFQYFYGQLLDESETTKRAHLHGFDGRLTLLLAS